MRKVLRRIFKVIVWSGITLFALLLVSMAGLVHYLRTPAGRARLVAFTLEKVRPFFPGGIKLGGIDGDYTTNLVLYDVELDDREHEPAVVVKRLELRYNLYPLLAGQIAVESMDAIGALVVSRPLRDGRDNLATMVEAPRPEPVTSLPVAVDVERMDIEVRFVRLEKGQHLEHAPYDTDVRGVLRATASVSRSIDVRVGELLVDVVRPTHARIEAHGTIDCLAPAFHNVWARVRGDAGELHRYVKQLDLHGPLVVSAEVDGTLAALDGRVSVDVPRAGWHVRTKALVEKTRARIDALHVVTPFASAEAHGLVHFDGHFDGVAKATVLDLSKLQQFGAPAMTGRTTLDATGAWDDKSLRVDAKATAQQVTVAVDQHPSIGKAFVDAHVLWDKHTVRVKAHATGEDLEVATAKLRELGLDVDSTDFLGHADAHVRGILVNGSRLYGAKVVLDSKPDGLSLRAEADGPEATSGILRIHGKPRLADKRFLGADATIDEIRFSVAGTDWTTTHTSDIHVDMAKREYELQRLDLAADDQRLSLAGKLTGTHLDSSLFEVKHFDFSRLAAVLSRGHVLPFSDLYAYASAVGPFDDPEVHFRASGETHGRSGHDLIHVAGQVEGQLLHKRANGKAFVTIGGQKASASFELPFPLRPDAPVHASVEASVLLSPLFAELITPKLIQFQPLVMFALSGKVTAHGTLDGTTSNPVVNLVARFANWEASGAHGGLGLSVEYKNKELAASFKSELSTLPAGGGSGGGILEVVGKVPLDLGAVLSGSDEPLLPQHTPVQAVLNLKHVGIDFLPLRAFGIIPPLQHGTVDGWVQVAGTYARPQVTTKFTASDFDWVKAGVGDMDAEVVATLEGGSATASARLSIGGMEAMNVKGSIDAGREENPFTADWRHAQLAFEGQSRKFDLSHLALFEGVDGLLDGDVKMTGTLAHPYVVADFDAPLLHIGTVGFRSFGAHGKLVDGRFVSSLKTEQQGGASLVADVAIPVEEGPISAHLEAHDFKVDLHGDRLPGIRVLRGIIDGKLAVTGTTLAPTAKGRVEVKDGELGVTYTAMRYRGIDFAAVFDGSTATLERGEVHAGTDGVAKLSGSTSWKGLRVSALDAKLEATKFPYQQQGVGLLLDGEVLALGKEAPDGGLRGHINVKRGSAQLPDLAQTRVLLPIGPIADVRVVADEKKEKKQGKHGFTFGALLDGPFVIKGKEVSARALGGLSIDLTGQSPRLEGSLRLDRGAWLDLFGRRYDVERGRITFDGSATPQLDFRISRRLPAATIGVDVSGTSSAPHLDFWSDPPSFDTTQVVAIILSGDPAANGVSADNMQRQAVGAISSLVVTSIKQKFFPELPIDVFRFDATDTTGTSTVGSQIEIGKYLTDSLYIGYAYQIGANREGTDRTNRNEARVDYRLPHDWQVEAAFGDAGTGGVDLYWTYRP